MPPERCGTCWERPAVLPGGRGSLVSAAPMSELLPSPQRTGLGWSGGKGRPESQPSPHLGLGWQGLPLNSHSSPPFCLWPDSSGWRLPALQNLPCLFDQRRPGGGGRWGVKGNAGSSAPPSCRPPSPCLWLQLLPSCSPSVPRTVTSQASCAGRTS